MKKNWIAGLDKQRSDEIRRDFDASAGLRQRLTDLLNDKIAVKRKEILSKDMYDSPSWTFYQADAIGYERAINEVISLIESESVTKR